MRWDSGIIQEKSLCPHAMEEWTTSELYGEYRKEWRLAGNMRNKDAVSRKYFSQARERWGRDCVLLGPEEGAFYSSPYCVECLKELIGLLEGIPTNDTN